MATIILTASYTTLGSLGIDYVYMKSQKTQPNPFTRDISYYGLSGDIAGLMIEKLNSTEFTELTGSRNSSIKNCLSVNESSPEQKEEMKREGFTIIDRAVSTFFILNDDIKSADDEHENINVKFMLLYLNRSISKYINTLISEDMQDDMVSKVKTFVNAKIKDVRRYLYDIQVRVTKDKRTITVELFESANKPLRDMVFEVSETYK